jgi:hypothetical protein
MAKNTIKLKKYVDIINEFPAGGAITPGHIVVLASTGKVAVGAAKMPLVALEDELQGRDIDTAFAADEPVQVWTPVRGEEAYCILAASQTIAKGANLEATSAGTLQALASGTLLCIALEAVTTGSGATARIKVVFV